MKGKEEGDIGNVGKMERESIKWISVQGGMMVKLESLLELR